MQISKKLMLAAVVAAIFMPVSYVNAMGGGLDEEDQKYDADSMQQQAPATVLGDQSVAAAISSEERKRLSEELSMLIFAGGMDKVDVDKARELLVAGADANYTVSDIPLLHFVLLMPNDSMVDMVALLLEFGADTEQRDTRGFSPLVAASFINSSKSRSPSAEPEYHPAYDEAVKILLNAGASLQAAGSAEKDIYDFLDKGSETERLVLAEEARRQQLQEERQQLADILYGENALVQVGDEMVGLVADYLAIPSYKKAAGRELMELLGFSNRVMGIVDGYAELPTERVRAVAAIPQTSIEASAAQQQEDEDRKEFAEDDERDRAPHEQSEPEQLLEDGSQRASVEEYMKQLMTMTGLSPEDKNTLAEKLLAATDEHGEISYGMAQQISAPYALAAMRAAELSMAESVAAATEERQ